MSTYVSSIWLNYGEYDALTINMISNDWCYVSWCVPIELKKSAGPFSRKWKTIQGRGTFRASSRYYVVIRRHSMWQRSIHSRLLPARIRLWECIFPVSYTPVLNSPRMWAKTHQTRYKQYFWGISRFLIPAIPQKNILSSSEYEQHLKEVFPKTNVITNQPRLWKMKTRGGWFEIYSCTVLTFIS